MELNIMTWNTCMYRDEDKKKVQEKMDVVLRFLEKNENAIAILQEIPFMEYGTQKESRMYEAWKEILEKKNYKPICISDLSADCIMMTVVVAKEELLKSIHSIDNRYVPVVVDKYDVNILGVHSQCDSFQVKEWIELHKRDFRPDIIAGDFNAGNYVKKHEDGHVKGNRMNYALLGSGYIDACQGLYTRYKKGSEATQIDHILINNSMKFNRRYRLDEVCVLREVNLSDHFPITCKLTLFEKNDAGRISGNKNIKITYDYDYKEQV